MIYRKSARELEVMRRAGAIVGDAHKLVASGLARIKLILDNLRRYLSVGDAELEPTDLAHEIDQALQLTAERLKCAGVRVEQQIDSLPLVRATTARRRGDGFLLMCAPCRRDRFGMARE